MVDAPEFNIIVPLSFFTMLKPGNLMNPFDQKTLFVTLCIPESDPGFTVVQAALYSFDHVNRVGAGLWQISTNKSTEQVFEIFNTNMVDRRIDSGASLFLLNPTTGEAKWHLQQPLSDLIASHWNFQNNLLISFSLNQEFDTSSALYERITKLGIWAPLGKTVWYVSSPNSTQDAFHYLASVLTNGDSLSILDGKGTLAFWQQNISDSPLSHRQDRAPATQRLDVKQRHKQA